MLYLNIFVISFPRDIKKVIQLSWYKNHHSRGF